MCHIIYYYIEHHLEMFNSIMFKQVSTSYFFILAIVPTNNNIIVLTKIYVEKLYFIH